MIMTMGDAATPAPHPEFRLYARADTGVREVRTVTPPSDRRRRYAAMTDGRISRP
jgi:hypothetical protein